MATRKKCKTRHVCVVLRGVLDWRTRKTINALIEMGKEVSLVHFSAEEIDKDAIPGCHILKAMPVGVGASESPIRLIRIAVNLGPKRIANHFYQKRQGAFFEAHMTRIIMSVKPDIIHAVNVDTLEASAVAAQKLGAYLVYEAFEYWPEHILEDCLYYDTVQRSTAIQAEASYTAHADLFFTVSDTLAKAYQEHYGLTHIPLVIYNAPIESASAATPAHQPLRFLFLGNLQEERNVISMLDAAIATPEVQFTFQGSGLMQDEIARRIDESGTQDRIFIKAPVPFEQIALSANSFDVGVLAHKSYNMQMEGALPNKFFEYLAGGLAVIVPDTDVFRNFPDIDDFALLVNDPDEKSLAIAFDECIQRTDINQMKKAALNKAREYTGDVQKERIQNFYSTLDLKTPLSQGSSESARVSVQ